MFRTSIKWNPVLAACAILAMFGTSSAVLAQYSGKTVWIPMQDKGLLGTKKITLEATLFKPDGNGPFPIVIFNHGSTGRQGARTAATQTENPWAYGRMLTQKGVALLVPMRRGRGKSEGRYREEDYDCSLLGARQGIRYAMESLDAVFDYLRGQSWVDMKRLVLAGQSRGGILSAIYASERPGTAVGVVNIVGGWFADVSSPRCQGGDINAALFKEAGSKSKVPNLFLYGKRDSYYSDASIQKYAPAFSEGGGDVEFKFIDAGWDGHLIFYNYFDRLSQDHAAFLTKVGIW